jgi:hypothetical protein
MVQYFFIVHDTAYSLLKYQNSIYNTKKIITKPRIGLRKQEYKLYTVNTIQYDIPGIIGVLIAAPSMAPQYWSKPISDARSGVKTQH